MTNDLKYGLILGGVVILIFIGWFAIKPGGPGAPPAQEDTPLETTSDVSDFWDQPTDVAATTRAERDTEADILLGPSVTEDAAGETGSFVVPLLEPDTLDASIIPEPVELPPEIAPVESGGTTHIIERGDVLTSISKTYYGTTTKWRIIFDANRDVIPNENSLTVGVEIVIPELPSEPSQPERPAVPVEVTTTGRTHTVAKGDTLYSIAKKYYGDGNQWRKIYEANSDKIPNQNVLKIGTRLAIP